MLYDTELHSRVVVPVKNLSKGGQVPKSLIMTRLLSQLSMVKATEEIGYFLAVTKLRSIEREGSGTSCCPCQSYLMFRVHFRCRTFMPQKGELMTGIVSRVLKRGVFLKCGPMTMVYLSSQLMPNYQYVEEEDKDPFYLSNDLSRIQKDVMIRFMVFAFRWNDQNPASRQFHILATIEGDSLGPISSAGSDGIDL